MNTSAYVDGKFFDEIQKAAQEFNQSESKIFKDITEMAIYGIKSGQISGILTEYQDHNPERWEILHYDLNSEEIELFSTTRQKYKISISKLAFAGFLLFWKILLLKYADKLEKKYNIKNFCSYDKFCYVYSELILYFKKRLKFEEKT
ncbi:MAG: hypothetical protein JW982_04335 [Spirochaetes bacterium]|nr:hypothetical protein [Spirochaetota bacterium]